MSAEMILAIDQGTTNTKAVLVDASGVIRARGSRPVRVHTPRDGWVEQDPEEIWGSVLGAIDHCLRAAVDLGAQIIGMGLSNQRESVLAWDRADGRPLSPVIGWQDDRTADDQFLQRPLLAELVRSRTGLWLDPMFSAPKLRWLTTAMPELRQARLGTIDSWLIQRLTGISAAEAGNASRTLLFDLNTLDWSTELAESFELSLDALAPVRPSRCDYGQTRGVDPLPDGIRLLAVLADSHAALLAQNTNSPGSTKATYGTGTSVMTPTATADLAEDARIGVTLGWLDEEPQFAYEGNILSSGSALTWTAALLGLGDVGALGRLAGTVNDTGGVTFVPALAGLGAPHWDRHARGQLDGLNTATGPAQIARAAFEAVAHQVSDVLDEIERIDPGAIGAVRADGGATASTLLMQLQADLTGRSIEVGDTPELSAVGVALLAWRALGVRPEPAGPTGTRVFRPTIGSDERAARRRQWSAAVVSACRRSVRP